MSIAASSTTAALISEMLDREDGLTRRLIDEAEAEIRTDGRKGTGSYPFRFSTVARGIQYLALALHEFKRTGSSGKLQPQWKEVLDLYNGFVQVYPALEMLPKAVTDDDLQGLCGFSTRRRGSHKTNFYLAMALFLTYVTEEKKLGDAELEFIRTCTSEGERDFAERIGLWFRTRLINEAQPMPEKTPSISGKVHEFPIAMLGYTYHPSLNEDFKSFFEHFVVEADGCAHFICYRPRNERPNQLVKSFLSIRPPAPGTDTFRFVHVYRIPSTGSQRRISIGAVLPLDGGVCLVGGQRQMTTTKEKTVPFTHLKIVVLPWAAIGIREKLFGGLVMSADYLGENLVSRVALRCTPTFHSDDVHLDAISLSALAEDLGLDLAKERASMKDSDDRFRIEGLSGARRIAELANNSPSHWEPPPGYFELGRHQTITKNPLEKHHIEEAIADRLGTDSDPKFRSKDKAPFLFWKQLRFGPLTGE